MDIIQFSKRLGEGTLGRNLYKINSHNQNVVCSLYNSVDITLTILSLTVYIAASRRYLHHVEFIGVRDKIVCHSQVANCNASGA